MESKKEKHYIYNEKAIEIVSQLDYDFLKTIEGSKAKFHLHETFLTKF